MKKSARDHSEVSQKEKKADQLLKLYFEHIAKAQIAIDKQNVNHLQNHSLSVTNKGRTDRSLGIGHSSIWIKNSLLNILAEVGGTFFPWFEILPSKTGLGQNRRGIGFAGRLSV